MNCRPLSSRPARSSCSFASRSTPPEQPQSPTRSYPRTVPLATGSRLTTGNPAPCVLRRSCATAVRICPGTSGLRRSFSLGATCRGTCRDRAERSPRIFRSIAVTPTGRRRTKYMGKIISRTPNTPRYIESEIIADANARIPTTTNPLISTIMESTRVQNKRALSFSVISSPKERRASFVPGLRGTGGRSHPGVPSARLRTERALRCSMNRPS